MIKIEAEAGAHFGQRYYYVTGLADGGEWLFWPEEFRSGGADWYGAKGHDRIWFASGTGKLAIYDTTTRQCLQFHDYPEGISDAVASRDGKFVHVRSVGISFHSIDTVTGRQQLSLEQAGRFNGGLIKEANDGRVFLNSGRVEDGGTRRFGLLAIDPTSGSTEHSEITFQSEFVHNAGFTSPSPSGRYWLKWDYASLPHRDVAAGLARFLPFAKKERYYGVTAQLWEAFPLRFVRRIVVVWLRAEQLPDVMGLAINDQLRSSPDPRRQFSLDEDELKEPLGEGYRKLREFYAMISAVSERVQPGPLDELPRSAFPDDIQKDDRLWDAVGNSWSAMHDAAKGPDIYWQSDDAAFWHRPRGLVSCVGIDGSLSPKIVLARHGIGGTERDPRGAESPAHVTPSANRTATILFRNGSAVVSGAASNHPFSIYQVPEHLDGWRDAVPMPDVIQRRIVEMREDEKKLKISLASLGSADCIAAIRALANEIGPDIYSRCIDNEIQAIFLVDSKRLDEEAFFDHVRKNCPAATDALDELIERFNQHGGSDIYWNDQTTAFAHAVLALATMDGGSVDAIGEYLTSIDLDHQRFVQDVILPGIVETHGWSPSTIELVSLVMLRAERATCGDTESWIERGLREGAAATCSPAEYSDILHDIISRYEIGPEESSPFGHPEISALHKILGEKNALTVWERAFFDAFREKAASKITTGCAAESWVGST